MIAVDILTAISILFQFDIQLIGILGAVIMRIAVAVASVDQAAVFAVLGLADGDVVGHGLSFSGEDDSISLAPAFFL